MSAPLHVKATTTDGTVVVVNMAAYLYLDPTEQTEVGGETRTITHIGMPNGDVLAVLESPDALVQAAMQQFAQQTATDEQVRQQVRAQMQGNNVLQLPSLGRV